MTEQLLLESYAERIVASMSLAERAILDLLMGHVGHERAIKSDEIIQQLKDQGIQLEDRQVRAIISNLVKIFKQPICSSTGGEDGPAGFFLRLTADEQIKTYKSLRRRGLSILARAAALRGIGLAELLGQLRLEMETGDGDEN